MYLLITILQLSVIAAEVTEDSFNLDLGTTQNIEFDGVFFEDVEGLTSNSPNDIKFSVPSQKPLRSTKQDVSPQSVSFKMPDKTVVQSIRQLTPTAVGVRTIQLSRPTISKVVGGKTFTTTQPAPSKGGSNANPLQSQPVPTALEVIKQNNPTGSSIAGINSKLPPNQQRSNTQPEISTGQSQRDAVSNQLTKLSEPQKKTELLPTQTAEKQPTARIQSKVNSDVPIVPSTAAAQSVAAQSRQQLPNPTVAAAPIKSEAPNIAQEKLNQTPPSNVKTATVPNKIPEVGNAVTVASPTVAREKPVKQSLTNSQLQKIPLASSAIAQPRETIQPINKDNNQAVNQVSTVVPPKVSTEKPPQQASANAQLQNEPLARSTVAQPRETIQPSNNDGNQAVSQVVTAVPPTVLPEKSVPKNPTKPQAQSQQLRPTAIAPPRETIQPDNKDTNPATQNNANAPISAQPVAQNQAGVSARSDNAESDVSGEAATCAFPCQNGGKCEWRNEYICEETFCNCHNTGFSGDNCTTKPEWCNPLCQNDGSCRLNGTTYACDCSYTGYKGDICTIDVDECASNPCQQGDCWNLPNGFACDCSGTGMKGRQCEIPADEFDVSKLIGGNSDTGNIDANSGTASTEELKSICKKPKPKKQPTVAPDNTSKCKSDPCQNKGSCTDTKDGFTCNCDGTGFTGTLCSEKVDNCDPNPCQNGGVCIDTNNDYICDCTNTGSKGKNCETDDPSASLDNRKDNTNNNANSAAPSNDNQQSPKTQRPQQTQKPQQNQTNRQPTNANNESQKPPPSQPTIPDVSQKTRTNPPSDNASAATLSQANNQRNTNPVKTDPPPASNANNAQTDSQQKQPSNPPQQQQTNPPQQKQTNPPQQQQTNSPQQQQTNPPQQQQTNPPPATQNNAQESTKQQNTNANNQQRTQQNTRKPAAATDAPPTIAKKSENTQKQDTQQPPVDKTQPSKDANSQPPQPPSERKAQTQATDNSNTGSNNQPVPTAQQDSAASKPAPTQRDVATKYPQLPKGASPSDSKKNAEVQPNNADTNPPKAAVTLQIPLTPRAPNNNVKSDVPKIDKTSVIPRRVDQTQQNEPQQQPDGLQKQSSQQNNHVSNKPVQQNGNKANVSDKPKIDSTATVKNANVNANQNDPQATVANACTATACKNNATCTTSSTATSGFKCMCTAEYTGTICDTKIPTDNSSDCLAEMLKVAKAYNTAKQLSNIMCSCSDGQMPDGSGNCAYTNCITISIRSKTICQQTFTFANHYADKTSTEYRDLSIILVASLHQLTVSQNVTWANKFCIMQRSFRAGSVISDVVVQKTPDANITDASAVSDLALAVDGNNGNLGAVGIGGASVNDLDECANSSLNTCLEGGTCTNTQGSYTCTCPTGQTDVSSGRAGTVCKKGCEGWKIFGACWPKWLLILLIFLLLLLIGVIIACCCWFCKSRSRGVKRVEADTEAQTPDIWLSDDKQALAAYRPMSKASLLEDGGGKRPVSTNSIYAENIQERESPLPGATNAVDDIGDAKSLLQNDEVVTHGDVHAGATTGAPPAAGALSVIEEEPSPDADPEATKEIPLGEEAAVHHGQLAAGHSDNLSRPASGSPDEPRPDSSGQDSSGASSVGRDSTTALIRGRTPGAMTYMVAGAQSPEPDRQAQPPPARPQQAPSTAQSSKKSKTRRKSKAERNKQQVKPAGASSGTTSQASLPSELKIAEEHGIIVGPKAKKGTKLPTPWRDWRTKPDEFTKVNLDQY